MAKLTNGIPAGASVKGNTTYNDRKVISDILSKRTSTRQKVIEATIKYLKWFAGDKEAMELINGMKIGLDELELADGTIVKINYPDIEVKISDDEINKYVNTFKNLTPPFSPSREEVAFYEQMVSKFGGKVLLLGNTKELFHLGDTAVDIFPVDNPKCIKGNWFDLPKLNKKFDIYRNQFGFPIFIN